MNATQVQTGYQPVQQEEKEITLRTMKGGALMESIGAVATESEFRASSACLIARPRVEGRPFARGGALRGGCDEIPQLQGPGAGMGRVPATRLRSRLQGTRSPLLRLAPTAPIGSTGVFSLPCKADCL